jgi:hypothetical protein
MTTFRERLSALSKLLHAYRHEAKSTMPIGMEHFFKAAQARRGFVPALSRVFPHHVMW